MSFRKVIKIKRIRVQKKIKLSNSIGNENVLRYEIRFFLISNSSLEFVFFFKTLNNIFQFL